jgi:hypothetical protein
MQRAEVIDVLASVHRRERFVAHLGEKRQMKAVEMEVENIEVIRTFLDLGEHCQMGRDIPGQLLVES